MKCCFKILFAVMCAGTAFAETPDETAARIKWFTDARFGMFIHFGAYSLAARHEWVKNYENVSDDEYARYVENFDPDMFDAKEWVQAAKDAGMKYIVLTTKHHDGFCLFDSKLTDYKVTNTPFGRDIVKEFADACHEAGIRCGFYYSLLDWHHPDYTKDYWYPGCKGKSKEELAELNKGRDFSKYLDYMHGQVRELLTNYGRVDILWYDFTTKTHGAPWWDTFKHTADWKGEELLSMTRELQPGIVVNDRLGNGVPADVVTPEQNKTWKWPTHGGKPAPAWESCQTFSGSWGYSRDEMTWKDVRQILTMIIDNVSKGGNTILNVGPTGRGAFDARAKDRLAGVGAWMKYNGRSIYGGDCRAGRYDPYVQQGEEPPLRASDRLSDRVASDVVLGKGEVCAVPPRRIGGQGQDTADRCRDAACRRRSVVHSACCQAGCRDSGDRGVSEVTGRRVLSWCCR